MSSIYLNWIIESISAIQGESARDRKVGKIKLYFDSEDIQVLAPKKFVNATDTVNHIINKIQILIIHIMQIKSVTI
ncbi:hypothetical protein FDB41_10580 [Clostridium botulinum]|nr:hypothetical protein [Clostridium botulinum]NFO53991.1 hypothetical protein [Clostridium botulinum]